MPLEALLTPVNLTDSASDGIDGGTGCNFIYRISLNSNPPRIIAPPPKVVYTTELHAGRAGPRVRAEYYYQPAGFAGLRPAAGPHNI